MLEKLRQKLTTQLDALTRPLQTLPPNLITILGLIASLAAGYYYSEGTRLSLLLGAISLILSGYFDVADGFVAKKRDSVTRFGGFLDSVADRYSDAAVLIGLIIGGWTEILPGAVALTGFLLVSYVRARAEPLGVKMATIGLMERAERLLILIGASILGFLTDSGIILQIAVGLLAVLTHMTVVQRIWYARERL